MRSPAVMAENMARAPLSNFDMLQQFLIVNR